MAKNKLTTEEILAAARAEASKTQDGGATAEELTEPKVTEEVSGTTEQGADTPETDKPAKVATKPTKATKKTAKTPTSTADILTAARAQANSDIKAPVEAQPPTVKATAAKTPTSTADILTAARAQANSDIKAPVETQPPTVKATVAKTSPKPPAAKKPAGEKPSVQEMLKAVREGKPLVPAKADKEPVKSKVTPIPVKPLVRKLGKAEPAPRRNFLIALVTSWFALAWTALTATAGLATLALARFMFPNVLVEPPTRFKIGPPNDYPLGSVSTKWKPSRGVWIVHTDSYKGKTLISALVSTCTHLGCTPNWLEGEQKFKCPCHGSGFYVSGINFEGPAPRPLERCGIRLAPDGMLEVDKSVKFQEEMGQWEDAASFVEVT